MFVHSCTCLCLTDAGSLVLALCRVWFYPRRGVASYKMIQTHALKKSVTRWTVFINWLLVLSGIYVETGRAIIM